jgi:hypothetical protein
LYTVLQLKGSELCAALPTGECSAIIRKLQVDTPEHKDGKETSISDKLHLKPCPTAPEPPEDDTQDQNNDDDKLPAAFIWDITQPKLGAITDITSAVGGVTIVYNKATLDTRGAIEMTEGYEYKFKFVPPA